MSDPTNLQGAIDLSGLTQSANQSQPTGPAAGPGGGQAPPPSGGPDTLVVQVNQENFGDVVATSQRVPVVLVITSAQSQPSRDLADDLTGLVGEFDGRLQLGVVDADANPQVAQALQVQQVPTTVALISGQPLPLFQGAAPVDQLRPVLNELLSVAKQNGIDGQLNIADDEAATTPPEEVEPEPAHAAALELIDAGDLEGAASYYRDVLKEAPADEEARVALTQVELLIRTSAADADPVAAATDPKDVDSQLAAADSEMAQGDVEAAFERLLATVRVTFGDERDQARQRLVEYFDVVGTTDERVQRARRLLASALY